jgi:hypothetical protein
VRHSGRSTRYERNRPPYDLKVIALYGFPIWVLAIAGGWLSAGWLGVKSVLLGLALLTSYIVISLLFAKKFDQMSSKSTGLAMSIVLTGFFVRLTVLWMATFAIYKFIEINLMALALTIGFGFTVVMLITIVRNAQELQRVSQ